MVNRPCGIAERLRRLPALPVRSPKVLVFKSQTESGRKDSNLRPPGPKPGALTRLSYAPSPGPCGPEGEVYPKSPGNQSGTGFRAAGARQPEFRTASGSRTATLRNRSKSVSSETFAAPGDPTRLSP